MNHSQGLKPEFLYILLARLKPCPHYRTRSLARDLDLGKIALQGLKPAFLARLNSLLKWQVWLSSALKTSLRG